MTEVPQHMAALGKANENRLARAELRAEVRSLSLIDGRLRVADLLEEPPGCLTSMRVADMLRWVRRVETYQAGRILKGASEAAISDRATVGSLSPRQRDAFARYLRGERETESRWAGMNKFVTGELRTAGQLVESRPESTRGEPTEGGCDARLPTPTLRGVA